MNDNIETFDLIIKPKGSPPEITPGLMAAAVIGIPKIDPENNTTLLLAGLTPESVAECGAYLIRVARAMKEGRAPEPFGTGHIGNQKRSRIITQPSNPFRGMNANKLH